MAKSLRDRIIKAEADCYEADMLLKSRLRVLSDLASQAFGEPLHADMCSGAEIEFRTCDDDGYNIDDFSCIRLEEVLDSLK